MFWFFVLVLAFVALLFLLPTWSYTRSRGWGYGPSGVALGIIALILIFWWLGLVAVWWPWYSY